MFSCKRVPLFEKQDPGNEQKRLDLITKTNLYFWERGSRNAVLHQNRCDFPLEISNSPQNSHKVSVWIEGSWLPGIDAHNNSVLLQQDSSVRTALCPWKVQFVPLTGPFIYQKKPKASGMKVLRVAGLWPKFRTQISFVTWSWSGSDRNWTQSFKAEIEPSQTSL